MLPSKVLAEEGNRFARFSSFSAYIYGLTIATIWGDVWWKRIRTS